MKTFSDRWHQLDWDDIRLRINGKTAADVEHALNASQLSRDDLMALLSPAALPFLEEIAQAAQAETRKHSGSASATRSAFMFRCISRTFAPTTAPTAAFP